MWFFLVSLLFLSRAISAPVEDIHVVTYPDGTGVRKLSPPPKPGIHPRIFLSPEDLPTLRTLATTSPARKNFYAAMRKTIADKLDNPKTPEGRVMEQLAKGQTPSDAQIASATELSYLLSLAAIDAQIQNDPVRGELLAKALTALGRFELTNWKRRPDAAGMHNSFETQLCLAYDFLAPWMTEEQRAPVRKFIAKMIDGIHIFTWDWPHHMRMWNWAGLHVYQGWASLAIEGEEGWNPQLWNEAKEVAHDFCKYNIHKSGALTEDITYFTLGFQGSGLVLIASAKRGDMDAWATTTNLSKLKIHLANQIEPWGGPDFMSHQDGCGNGFYATWTLLKYMYPLDPLLDWTWRNRVTDDYSNGGAANDASNRAWFTVLFNTEYLATPVPPEKWTLPTTYFCPDRSYLVARTGWDKNAMKLDFEAKTDYPVVGHNHADANNFTLAALGREWATEFGYHGAAGILHNNVAIDGRSESGWPTAGGYWVDLVDTPQATIGVSDASRPYNWQWSDSGYTMDNNPPSNLVKWERDTSPDVMEFVREQEASGKGRLTIFDHWGPVIRSVWNPVEKAFRSAALIRGKRPYTFIVDDIRKDSATHLFQWNMMMPEDVEIIKAGGRWVDLGAKEMPPTKGKDGKEEKAQPDKRRLLVQVVDVDLPTERDGMAITLESTLVENGAFEGSHPHTRLVIPARTDEPHFKILLYPHMEGDPLPDVLWNDEHTACTINFPDQSDCWTFAPAANGRTAMTVSRNGSLIATVKAAPAAPVITSVPRVFTDRFDVTMALPGFDQEIRYTTDGSEPTANSTFYAGPFSVDATCTVKAATFARRWAFGDQHRSTVTEARFTKEVLNDAVAAPASLSPGLVGTVYQGYWNKLPDFATLKPLFTAPVPKAVFPGATPAKGFGVVLNGLIRVPADGVYAFGLTCDDAGKIWIDDQVVADNDGQHVVRTARGEIALKAGLHAIRIANVDGALALGKGKGDGSWAFTALWAPSGAELTEIPASAFANAGGATAAAEPPVIPAAIGLRAESGLDYAVFDRSSAADTADLFKIDGAEPLAEGIRERIATPDSSPNLLHVYRGYVSVPQPGTYEFRGDTAGILEVRVGRTVVFRVEPDGNSTAQPVRLAPGPAPIEVRIAKGSGQIRWQGPGLALQPISPLDFSRELRPLATIAGRPLDCSAYELFGPTSIALGTAGTMDGLKVVYTLDGSDPVKNGKTYEKPIDQSAAVTLRARCMAGGKPVGAETTIRLVASATPTLGLLGCWSPAKLQGTTMRNQVAGQAGDLPLPEGTRMVDDPVQGKILDLDHSSMVLLDKTAILANELTMAFRVKSPSSGNLLHYGYAHFGIFLSVNGNGSLTPGGGGVFHAGETKDDLLNDGKWHQVAVTYGGTPIRQIETWIDGVKQGSGRSQAPCVTKELEFLGDFTGQLAEVRMYNRILGESEIAALNRGCGQPAKP